MPTLSSHDYLQLLEVVRELNAVSDLDEFPHRVLALVPRLVGSERTAYNEVNLKRGRIVALIEPSAPGPEEIATWLEPHIATHPLISHFAHTSDPTPVAISDFWSRRTYSRSAIYNECFRALNIEDQLALTLNLESHTIVALTVNRNRRTFSKRDRIMLELLRPHLAQAYANATSATLLRREVSLHEGLWDTLSHGVLVLDARGKIAFCSTQAVRWLHHYWGSGSTCGGSAPATLLAWLRESRAEPLGAQPLHITHGDATLIVRESGTIPEGVMLLLEENVSRPPLHETRALQSLGLTPRQSEVLFWVARGATNQQIAERLDLSLHTAKRHLEAIYDRLGVESRTAAAFTAQQVLRDAQSGRL